MKTENTLINELKNSISIELKRNNPSLVQKLLNDKAKEKGFMDWKDLCNQNKKDILKTQQLNDISKDIKAILESFQDNKVNNTILIENIPQLNHEILRQKVRNQETIIILADLNPSALNHLVDMLKTEGNYKLNLITDNNVNSNINNQRKKKETREIFLTKHIHAQNIRDFILDMMDMSSAWSNKPMLLFASYWNAMSYKVAKNEYLAFQELKDMIQFNQYFSLYEELKNEQSCPKYIWTAMENFLKSLPQINLNQKEQKQVVYEQYGFIQMQIMKLINNLLVFESNNSEKNFNKLLNSQQVTILNIYSEEPNKKAFNLRLYLHLINNLYKSRYEEIIRKNRRITLNLINVLNERLIDKLFYLNNDYLFIIASSMHNEIHNLLRDNFQIIIK